MATEPAEDTGPADGAEFDIVVAGSGAAGMTAALTAAHLGLSVLVIEKTGFFGGSTARSGGGIWAPGNAVLRAARVAGRAARTRLLGHRMLSMGQALAAGLRAGLLTSGVPVWLDTPMTGLEVRDGRVSGVRVTRGGEPLRIGARRGVLIAAGGFERNDEMRRRYQRAPVGTEWTTGAAGNTGDGILAGLDLGADAALMDDAWWGPSIPLPGGPYFCLAERSLPGLAQAAGVDAEGLVKTVTRFGEFAATGKGEEFGRGDSAYDRYYGDPRRRPNPNLAPLDRPPFYAVKIVPGDLGTKGGLRTDEHARVLRADGTPIEGLYAAGNASASVMGHSYAGAGATIGPAMTFGYIAARIMAAAP